MCYDIFMPQEALFAVKRVCRGNGERASLESKNI